ncbi:MAG: heparinase II/III family protein [Pseudomonadota bacterium]
MGPRPVDRKARAGGDAAGSGVDKVTARLRRAWGESPFYQAQLNGPAPDRFAFMPVDPRTPNAQFAAMLRDGKFAVGGQTAECDGELDRVWDRLSAPGPLYAYLHEFVWLRHAGALGKDGVEPARTLTRGWLDRFEKWSPAPWAPMTTAERLILLCCHAGPVLKGMDALWRSRVLASMARQVRHLARAGWRSETAEARLSGAFGLTIAGFCLPGCAGEGDRGIELLRRELRLQMRPDGGHVSGDPSRQLALLIRLQMVVRAVEKSRGSAPGFLTHAEARAAAFLNLFRVGDGRLALFNGGYEDDPAAVEAALQSVDEADAPTGFARHSGFQRLSAGRVCLIANTGPAVRRREPRQDGRSGTADDKPATRGVGAFHLSSGRARIVGNCGSGAHLSADWASALRDENAQSTVSAGDGGPTLVADLEPAHRRGEDARGQLLEIERVAGDGAGEDPARHLRVFFLAAEGGDLRGRDVFSGPLADEADRLAIRFHLHPSVKAALSADRRTVVLTTATSETWRFRADGAGVTLERSVYCGEGGAPARSDQIVLTPRLDARDVCGGLAVRWGFKRADF